MKLKKSKFALTTAQTAVFMAILTFAGKLLGMIREVVQANYYGTGMVSDAYVMAQKIPDAVMAAVISAAALSYMPMLSSKLEKEGLREGNRFTSQLINLLMLVSGGVAILGSVFAPRIVGLLAWGYEGETAELTVFYMRWVFISIIFNAVVVIMEAYLQYRNVFLPQPILGYVQNISIISFMVLSSFIGYRLLIFGRVIGWALRALALLLLGFSRGYRHSLSFSVSGAVKEAAILAVPIFIGGSVNQINTMIDSSLASGLSAGSVSALYYGNLLVGFISAMTATVLLTMLYPRMNQAFVTEDYDRIGALAERSINLIVMISVPLTMGVMAYSSSITKIIYERGFFGEASTDMTKSALFYYAIGISFIAVSQIITKLFYSMHNTKTAVKCSAIAVLTNIVLNLILIRFMGHSGLALATGVAQIINAALLYYAFRHRYPGIKLLRSWKKIIMISVLSTVSIGISYGVYVLLRGVALPELICFAAAAALAAAIYLTSAKIAGFEELDLLSDLIKRGEKEE